jgi:anti-sigma factor RsiW
VSEDAVVRDDHGTLLLLEDYARGAELPADQVWALEVHLETCGRCRGTLADVVAGRCAPVAGLVGRVWTAVDAAAAPRRPRPAWRRWVRPLSTWATPAMAPWLGGILLVVLLAWLVDFLGGPGQPGVSVLTLVAPVAPLLGIAAAWSRGLDPAHEVVAGTPRAGLQLVLRRTTAVLVVVIPPLLVGNWLTGTTSVLWLLPCLVFSLATLALGSLVGLLRAAVGLLVLWVALVLLPSLLTGGVPVALRPVSVPGWIVAAVLGAALVAVRLPAFRRLADR